MTEAADVVAALTDAERTVATAESLTGGLVCAALVDAPGASEVLRGGLIAYAAEVKTGLLGVDEDLVARHGTIDARTAEQMAQRVRTLLGADYGVATTGVAGPVASEGHLPGTAYIAVAGPETTVVRRLDLPGNRAQVRAGVVEAVLATLLAALKG